MKLIRGLFAIAGWAILPAALCPVQAQTFKHVPPLAFTKPFGGANPLPQIITVASTGTDFRFSAVAATATGGNWLQLSPQGAGCCNTPEALTVSVNPAIALAAGTYSGQITFSSYPGSGASMTVPIVLTVVPPNTPLFDNLPGELSFSMKPGGSPPAKEIEVRNGGSGILNWTLTKSTADGGNWLTISTAGGTAPSAVTVGIAHSALPGGGLVAGTFVGQLVFKSGGRSVTIPVSAVVGNSVFSQVNPIRFTMAFGGPNPLPQILTVATSDATVARFSAVAATAKGANWLQISPQGAGCCYSPEAITVGINAATLPAGSYTGQITFTAYPRNNMTMTVPVTLTVAPPSGPFFDDVAGQMSFFTGVGGTPPAQVIQIQNGGTGTLSWTLTETTADGGNWLSVSQVSGTAPASTATITVLPGNLPGGGLIPGTFVGQLVFETPGSSVTVPVGVVVGDDVFLQTNPISFSKAFGGANPLPQTLTVASSSSTVRFSAVAANAGGGNWLQISPQGTGCCYTPEAITLSVNAASLAPGVYTAQVTFYEYPSGSMSMTVPVTLTVAQAIPFFDNLPGHLSFFLETGGKAPPAQEIQIRNGGPGALAWNLKIATADGGSWLSSSASSGTAPSTVAIRLSPALLPGGGLLAGTYSGELFFRASGASISVPVSVVVGANVFRQVNPINFTKVFGGPNPLPQILTVASTGSAALRFTAVANTANGGNWLQISPQGVGCCYTPETVSVTVNAATLAAGTYTAQLTFTEYPQNNMSMTVPVTLTVAPQSGAFFDNVPGQLSFSMKSGGNAPQQVMQVRNGGVGALNWTLAKSTSDGGSWLTASAASGTAPMDVSVGIVRQALPGGGLIAGSFTGQIVLKAPGSIVTIPITAVVGNNIFQQVNPITFTMKSAGPNPLPQIVTIASTGTTALRFTVAATTAKGGSWLQASPQGIGCCYTPEVLSLSVNAATLAAGTYTGQITITEYPGNDLSITVPVTLTVAPPSGTFLDYIVGQLSFSMTTGATPPGKAIQVRNGGTGTLNWTLTKTTADGGNWLNVSASNGTGAATITVGIAPAALPGAGQIAGIYVGHLLLRAAGNSMTVPVSVAVGANVFRQVNGISFTKAFGAANPPSKVITVAGTGAVLRFSAVAANAKGGSWLQISPRGVGCCYTPTSATISVNAATLAPGIYLGQVMFTQYPGNDMAMTVPVTLTVTGSQLTGTDPLSEETQ